MENYLKGKTRILGQCLCGNIQFSCQIHDAPFKIYQCHCTLCKKQSGSSSNSATIIDADDFKWINNANIKSWRKSTGFSAHFCGNCGSPVPNVFLDKYYWIPVGLLELDNDLIDVEIVANLCLSTQSSWHNINTNEKSHNFDAAPEFKTLMKLLA